MRRNEENVLELGLGKTATMMAHPIAHASNDGTSNDGTSHSKRIQ